jgi:cyclin D1/2/4, plant
MDFLCPDVSTTSLLCEESCESIFGLSDGEGEAPESNMDLGLSTIVDLYLESSDDFVGSLVHQEKEQLACIATGDYLERLNNGGIESAWRADAIEWFGKVRKSSTRILCEFCSLFSFEEAIFPLGLID